MLFLIVTILFSALCCFLLLPCSLARSVLFLIVTMLFSMLCVVFDCYDDV